MKRTLVFIPEINPLSFVLLFAKGEGGTSWSVRDYSRADDVSVTYAAGFKFLLSEITERILIAVDAPVRSVNDVQFWHRLTRDTNAAHPQLTGTSLMTAILPKVEDETRSFPLYNAEHLMTLAKSRKVEDLRRMRQSKQSEDWVTWNTFALVQRFAVSSTFRSKDLVDAPSWPGPRGECVTRNANWLG